ncbi:MAG TPA: ferritin-like domain-containing protein [Myxococcaceae bacterium]|jgi:hypothetical protein
MSAWPPYETVEDNLAAHARNQLSKLYHVGQEHAWDGREVLADLIRKHGPPRFPPEKREAAMEVLSVLLWGELAAWVISADLAQRLEDVDAKMAATAQAHDEARHFYVLRDYLLAEGGPVPRLKGLSRRLLVRVLRTSSVAEKLVGMQLLVESNALAIFRGLAKARLEPVLTELLQYYERDEGRHVGLGVMYLPRALSRMGVLGKIKLALFQARCVWLLMCAGLPVRRYFETLGMDLREIASSTVEIQGDVLAQMRDAEAGGSGQLRRRARFQGVLNPSEGAGPRLLDFMHPPGGVASRPRWHQLFLRAWTWGARVADRLYA